LQKKEIIMSGMRPTGKLHLGHYMGVLKNWLSFQNDYQCFFAIADWHALTTKFDQTEGLKQNIVDVALDWLACGINPDNSVIYLQSLVPETAELHLLLSMITPQNWVERDTTLKDMVKMLRGNTEETDEAKSFSGLVSYGLMGYPVLQTADIIQFNASMVPVGKDQLAHLEISRDIVRRFNHLYKVNLIKEPQPKLTETPLLKGIDGQKMGKSFNNDIKISDTEEITTKKIMQAITDRNRIKKTDPGNPANCEVVCPYYQVFADEETVKKQRYECENALRGCADCKRELASIINSQFREIRERRESFAQNPERVHEIIKSGSEKARESASAFLKEIKQAMKLY
jgi:tryptophanyl-tRNA synthetase